MHISNIEYDNTKKVSASNFLSKNQDNFCKILNLGYIFRKDKTFYYFCICESFSVAKCSNGVFKINDKLRNKSFDLNYFVLNFEPCIFYNETVLSLFNIKKFLNPGI